MYELLSTYIDFGTFLFIGKYLLAFFVVGIIVLIFCKKLKLFKRQNKILDKLTYLYYLYIPTIFIAFSITYTSAAYVKKETIALINEAAPSINAQATTYLDEISFPQDLSISNIRDIVHAYISRLTANIFEEFDVLPHSFKLYLSEQISSELADKISALADKILTAKAKEFTSLDKSLWSTNIRELVKNGFVTNLIADKAKERISDIEDSIIIVFLLLLLIPFIETAVSKQIEKRKSRE